MASDEEYEHWPANKTQCVESPAVASGYDANNGLHYHYYIPPKAEPAPATVAAAPAEAQTITFPQPVFYAHPPSPATHPPAQYYPHPVYSVAPGYYHPYPPAAPLAVAAPVPVVHVSPALMPSSHTANHHTYVPAADGATGAAHAADAQANAWLGRTTAQVEEDNMKIAKAEGAYDKRQVAPTGLKDDQMCWVVELDGTHNLRMFRDVKAMNGVWKEDPRYKDAWYFICEEEEKEEEEKKKD